MSLVSESRVIHRCVKGCEVWGNCDLEFYACDDWIVWFLNFSDYFQHQNSNYKVSFNHSIKKSSPKNPLSISTPFKAHHTLYTVSVCMKWDRSEMPLSAAEIYSMNYVVILIVALGIAIFSGEYSLSDVSERAKRKERKWK